MARPDTRYVRAGEADVAYQVVGDGPMDLVYHHGMCHLDFQWDVRPEAAFNQRLASFSRLILFDRRGSGASERMAREFLPTAEDWCEDLLSVLDAAGSRQAAVFAEAEAGPTAIRFAVEHPDRVSALVLANTWPRWRRAPDYPIGMDDAAIGELLDVFGTSWGTPEAMAVMFPYLADDPDTIEAIARLCRGAATPAMAVALYRHVFQELDVRDQLTAVGVPTLVLDNGHPAAGVLADRIPGAQRVAVDNEEALLFTGDFDATLDEVEAFLTGRPVAAAPTRILTTVLFTDIVGSTRRAATEGDARWRALLDTHDRLTRNVLADFGGREVNTTGDGFLACFSTPTAAVACAKAIVRRLDGAGLPVRAGLHSGECELRGDDLAGLAVHIAARVGALAAPGEVLVSRTVADLLVGSGLPFEDHGRVELTGVPGMWELFTAVDEPA